jgi:hypothetical protein
VLVYRLLRYIVAQLQLFYASHVPRASRCAWSDVE